MLLINMLKALDSYLQRRVIKEPKPATLEEAIQRTWRIFHTVQPPVPQPQVAHAVATSCAPAVAPPVHVSIPVFIPPSMDVDAMRLLLRSPSPGFRKLWSCPSGLQCLFRQAYDPYICLLKLISRVRTDQRSPTRAPPWAF